MRAWLVWASAFALMGALAGCDGGDAEDAGTLRPDTGMMGTDSGPGTDSGMTGGDSGPGTDSGTGGDSGPGTDSGTTPTGMCTARTVSSSCGNQAVVRSRVLLGSGMGSMTGTVRVTLAHTSLGSLSSGGVYHIDGTTSGAVSETVAAEVQFDFCGGGEMWSEENGGYNLWAYLDLNSNGALDAGEPAGNAIIELSCNATESPCHTIVLDCTTRDVVHRPGGDRLRLRHPRL